MSYQGNDVVLNGTQLVYNGGQDIVSPDDVIVADGYPRTVIIINGQFPGPTIEVNAGTTVGVHEKHTRDSFIESEHVQIFRNSSKGQ
jgi:Multicopper oxidase